MSRTMFCHKDTCNRLKKKKVLLFGDFMLDVYTIGRVKRISPEAPVPVLCVSKEHSLPGGAGNTSLNLVALGMEVTAVGRVGDDPAGRELIQELKQERVDTSGIFVDQGYLTPQKNRMMADSQQIVRVDYEETTTLSSTLENQVIESLPQLMREIDLIAISDYAKGFLTPTLLEAVIELAQVPVIVDPKGMDFSRYRGATIIKPNYGEALAAAGLGQEATLDEVAAKILEENVLDTLIVTRSKEGMSIFEKDGMRQDFPAVVHEVRDVTGAGDTVLAVLTAALANEISLAEAAQLSNVAAAIAIERTGCARVSLEDLQNVVKRTPVMVSSLMSDA